jgi:hypothetical protein
MASAKINIGHDSAAVKKRRALFKKPMPSHPEQPLRWRSSRSRKTGSDVPEGSG